MDKDTAVVLFSKLESMSYEVEADPETEEEPFTTGFREPTFEVELTAGLLDDSMVERTPVPRIWQLSVRFPNSVFRPEGNGLARQLLDLADEAGVSVDFQGANRATLS